MTAITEDHVETQVGTKCYRVSSRLAKNASERYGLLTYTCVRVEAGYTASWEATLTGKDGVATPFKHPGLKDGAHWTTGPSPRYQPGFATVENAIQHWRNIQALRVEKAIEALHIEQLRQRELNVFADTLAQLGINPKETPE